MAPGKLRSKTPPPGPASRLRWPTQVHRLPASPSWWPALGHGRISITASTRRRPSQSGRPQASFPPRLAIRLPPRSLSSNSKWLTPAENPRAESIRDEFVIRVDGTQIHPPAAGAPTPLIASTYTGGHYLLVVRAPANPGCNPCPITVEYGGLSGHEDRGPRLRPRS